MHTTSATIQPFAVAVTVTVTVTIIVTVAVVTSDLYQSHCNNSALTSIHTYINNQADIETIRLSKSATQLADFHFESSQSAIL